MKGTRKILCILLVFTAVLFIGTIKSNAGDLHLNNLNFDVKINFDGSMDVTEIWDIYISETNTLYKSFATDTSKYSGITNVSVAEIVNNTKRNFKDTYEWAYHVEKNGYYGTYNDEGDFEIGWGVGLDNSSATREYEIKYTVEDAICKHSDYAELYWQFVGKDFNVSADNVTGTIKLPSKAENISDIKVWGHSEGLNGTIYATSTDTIEFNLDRFRSGRYIEIRSLFPSEMIYYSGRSDYKEVLNDIIEEETVWAEEANARREREKKRNVMIFLGVVLLNIILFILYFIKTVKYIKKNKELKINPPIRLTTEYEYYRDFPDENASPAEAFILKNKLISNFSTTAFGKIFSATILDLCLKGYLKVEEIEKEKNNFNIYILKQTDDNISDDEKEILNFIIKASNNKDILTMKELKKYITNHPSKASSLLENTYKKAEKIVKSKNYIDEKSKKEYADYCTYGSLYSVFGIFGILFILGFLVGIVFLINSLMCFIISKKIVIYTQEGYDKHIQWNALEKFMKEFSMLDKREVPELALWEKYLVYATAFGIADTVLKQLKVVYPNLDENSNLSSYTYMHMMMNSDFSSSFSGAMSSSMSSACSSGSGGGGGFSGGGGGGRRPEVVEEEDNSFSLNAKI